MSAAKRAAKLLEEAIAKNSSDVFILPTVAGFVLYFRTKNGLTDQQKLIYGEGRELINYFKYSAEMDLAEHRRPQVGAYQVVLNGQSYAVRLSSIGDFHDRESLVLRIIYDLATSSYFYPEQFEELAKLVGRRGLILTSGPTGSGKTTTMYSLAQELARQGQLVLTIEDPVEVAHQEFLQTQINDEAGISYQALLKAALRHRPDVLIIGEIRDQVTARLAVDAALSGHLVLATVHAKSTYQTISRLESLGIGRTDLCNCLTAVSYQRLLPTASGQACLLDLAAGRQLTKLINSDQRADFVAWRQNLATLVKEGRLDLDAYELFQQG